LQGLRQEGVLRGAGGERRQERPGGACCFGLHALTAGTAR
jgi:hypothetical protein